MLINLFNLYPHKSYSIIGLAKNSGKTTVLNYLLHEIKIMGKTAGITSIGWDGEKKDRHYEIDKPEVLLPQGFYALTCKSLIPYGTSFFSIQKDTGIGTILGNIYLIKAEKEGKVEIVGPRNLQDIKKVLHLLKSNTDYIFVDGALDRMTSASPMITDGFILAVAAGTMHTIQTLDSQIKLLASKYFKSAALRDKKIPSDYYGSKTVKFVSSSGLTNTSFSTLLGHEKEMINASDDFISIYTPGAFTDMTVERMIPVLYNMTIYINDFTRDLTSEKTQKILDKRDVNVVSIMESNLQGITVSSFSPKAVSLISPLQLLSMIEKYFPKIPVIDVFLAKNKAIDD